AGSRGADPHFRVGPAARAPREGHRAARPGSESDDLERRSGSAAHLAVLESGAAQGSRSAAGGRSCRGGPGEAIPPAHHAVARRNRGVTRQAARFAPKFRVAADRRMCYGFFVGSLSAGTITVGASSFLAASFSFARSPATSSLNSSTYFP